MITGRLTRSSGGGGSVCCKKRRPWAHFTRSDFAHEFISEKQIRHRNSILGRNYSREVVISILIKPLLAISNWLKHWFLKSFNADLQICIVAKLTGSHSLLRTSCLQLHYKLMFSTYSTHHWADTISKDDLLLSCFDGFVSCVHIIWRGACPTVSLLPNNGDRVQHPSPQVGIHMELPSWLIDPKSMSG